MFFCTLGRGGGLFFFIYIPYFRGGGQRKYGNFHTFVFNPSLTTLKYFAMVLSLTALFQGLGSLIVLNLSNNLISGLQPGMFEDLANLQILDTSWNRIQQIPQGNTTSKLLNLKRPFNFSR